MYLKSLTVTPVRLVVLIKIDLYIVLVTPHRNKILAQSKSNREFVT